jgi:hypothetical protein
VKISSNFVAFLKNINFTRFVKICDELVNL